MPIHDEAATVCREIYASRFCKWGQRWLQLSDPCNLPSCNTHPLISCGRAEISDPSPEAVADSQIAQNCSRHRQLLTFPLFLNWQRIYYVKPPLKFCKLFNLPNCSKTGQQSAFHLEPAHVYSRYMNQESSHCFDTWW